MPLEISKVYKRVEGKKVYGLVPTKDKDFRIKHIELYLPFIDEKIEVDAWYEAASKITSSSDACIVVGIPAGIMRALTVLKFHYRFRNCKTKPVLFKNTISSPLHKEIKKDIPIDYISSIKELENFL